MSKPNQDQVDAGIAILKAHITNYGNTAAETRLASTIYAIHAAMSGDGEPAQEHAAALEAARQAKKPKVAVAVDDGSKAAEAAQALKEAEAKAAEEAELAATKEKLLKDAEDKEEADAKAAQAVKMPPSKQANKETSK
jgi:hypothetical protein